MIRRGVLWGGILSILGAFIAGVAIGLEPTIYPVWIFGTGLLIFGAFLLGMEVLE